MGRGTPVAVEALGKVASGIKVTETIWRTSRLVFQSYAVLALTLGEAPLWHGV